jgi:ribonuclease HI
MKIDLSVSSPHPLIPSSFHHTMSTLPTLISLADGRLAVWGINDTQSDIISTLGGHPAWIVDAQHRATVEALLGLSRRIPKPPLRKPVQSPEVPSSMSPSMSPVPSSPVPAPPSPPKVTAPRPPLVLRSKAPVVMSSMAPMALPAPTTVPVPVQGEVQLVRTESGKGLWVQGQTKDHKEQLKAMGGKWNASKRSWVVPQSKQAALLQYFNLSESDIQAPPVEIVPDYYLHFDGASKGNPGPAGYGYCITPDETGQLQGSGFLGKQTNNVAEWQGVINGLRRLVALNLASKTVQITGDSQLVIRQLSGQYQVHDAKLIPLHAQAVALINQLITQGLTLIYKHVPREQNQTADSLASNAATS